MSEPDGQRPIQVRREDDLLEVTLADPARANALSVAMIEALTETYARDWLAEGVRAIILSAQGKHFSAGADLEHLGALLEADSVESSRDSERLRNLFAAVLEQDALTVALVQGACIAGGCGLATAHDFVIASEGARFMYSEAKIGFVAALVATFLPLRLSGRDIRELLLNPEFLPATKALEIGLVNRVVTEQDLEKSGRRLATEVLERASSSSIALTKRLLRDALGRPLTDRLDRAATVNAESRSTADCRRGVTAFLETKASPRWR